jgi:hypothetical protein
VRRSRECIQSNGGQLVEMWIIRVALNDIERRRTDAGVLLVKAIGGGWDTSQLPSF